MIPSGRMQHVRAALETMMEQGQARATYKHYRQNKSLTLAVEANILMDESLRIAGREKPQGLPAMEDILQGADLHVFREMVLAHFSETNANNFTPDAKGGMTFCYLYIRDLDVWRVVGKGTAYCLPDDAYVKSEGRGIAYAEALRTAEKFLYRDENFDPRARIISESGV